MTHSKSTVVTWASATSRDAVKERFMPCSRFAVDGRRFAGERSAAPTHEREAPSRRSVLFVTLLAALAGCGSDRAGGDEGAASSAISAACGVAPAVGPCQTVACASDGLWETSNRPAGATCLGTGSCDANGHCVLPPPSAAVEPSCDAPPPPRYAPGQVGNYPNGADVLTCTRPSSGIEAWHIEYPSVDRSTTDYPTIAFNAGDSVTLSASGCVQTGGHGSTWKRYVDPDSGDGHLDSQYYGTLQISGVTGEAVSQTIQHWIGPAFVTPNAGHLVLGYVDDGLADNGYYSHDDGADGQCVGQSKVTVDVLVDHNPRNTLSCAQWNSFGSTPVAADVPELSQLASLLRAQAEVPLGLPITPDTPATGIGHFQIFQDGAPGDTTTVSNRPLNSAELHADGCAYVAFTPLSAPAWYPIDLAWDHDPQKGWQARPWDTAFSDRSFDFFETNNRDPSLWLSTFVPGTCLGAGSAWRWTAPRWIEVCPPQVPPAQWTPTNVLGFPKADPESSKVSQSGAVCGWQIKNSPSLTDGCIDAFRAEWTGVNGFNGELRTAEGVVTNSFLSGGDYSGDHNGMPEDHFVGVHSDALTHTDVDDCPTLANVAGGEHCADWEVNLRPDPNYRHLLAADESQRNDRDGGDCKSKHAEYRQGNQKSDLLGALGIEGEQWYYPLGFRPEPGDRAVIRGSYIVDCGHADWHTELHPASLLQSSYLQRDDYSPVEGATWNRPLRLTSSWRSLTGGAPAVVTKVVLSPVFAEGAIAVDIWPPARPCAGARLVTAKEDVSPNPAWSGVQIVAEELLPADGNPNHLRVTMTRGPYALRFGGDGDVQNPDPNLSFFTAYMAWWNVDGAACPSAGGPGSGPPPAQGGACAANGANGANGVSDAVLLAGVLALFSVTRRRQKWRVRARRIRN